jgi:flagellar basal body-associated protein FliL
MESKQTKKEWKKIIILVWIVLSVLVIWVLFIWASYSSYWNINSKLCRLRGSDYTYDYECTKLENPFERTCLERELTCHKKTYLPQ